MKYDVIQSYFDCPYKAFLTMAHSSDPISDTDKFHYCASSLLSAIFKDGDSFHNRLKINKHIHRFQNNIESKNITSMPIDLPSRRAIASVKRVIQRFDSNRIVNVVPKLNLINKDSPLEDVLIQISGYIEVHNDVTSRNHYVFYIYSPNLASDEFSHRVMTYAIFSSLKNTPFINKDYVPNSEVVYVNFHNGLHKNVKLNDYRYSKFKNILASVVYSIKLGISHPSPAQYHCSPCSFRNSCKHACHNSFSKATADESESDILVSAIKANNELVSKIKKRLLPVRPTSK